MTSDTDHGRPVDKELVDLRLQIVVGDEQEAKTVIDMRSDSFVKQWYLHEYAALQNARPDATDTNGDSRPIEKPSNSDQWMDADAGSSTTGHGIVIGDGATSPDFSDNKLESQLTSSWNYAQTDITKSDDSTSGKIDISRAITNQTGSKKTITEAALYVRSTIASKTVATNYCVIRDTFAGVEVENGEQISVNYEIEWVV